MNDRQVHNRQLEDDLGEELLRIHQESYGKGAARADVTLTDDVVYCLLDGIELLPNEEFMIDAGRGDAVVRIRLEYQQAIEATFRAAVERATGRRVVSFASVTKLSPPYVVEIFRLGPRKQSALAEPDDG
jgi:uncharacterized protein YbcI